MTSCGIQFIAKDAFKNFTKMEHLDLSGNYEGLSATNIAEMMSHSFLSQKLGKNKNQFPARPKFFSCDIPVKFIPISVIPFHDKSSFCKDFRGRPLRILLKWNI
jgi:hypothetical protein